MAGPDAVLRVRWSCPSRSWMKCQPLVAAPAPVKSRRRACDIAWVAVTGIRIRLWISYGLFTDELARLLPANMPLELLQTKDVDELSVLQNRGGTLANFAAGPRPEKPDQVAKKRDRAGDLALQYDSQALIFGVARPLGVVRPEASVLALVDQGALLDHRDRARAISYFNRGSRLSSSTYPPARPS